MSGNPNEFTPQGGGGSNDGRNSTRRDERSDDESGESEPRKGSLEGTNVTFTGGRLTPPRDPINPDPPDDLNLTPTEDTGGGAPNSTTSGGSGSTGATGGSSSGGLSAPPVEGTGDDRPAPGRDTITPRGRPSGGAPDANAGKEDIIKDSGPDITPGRNTITPRGGESGGEPPEGVGEELLDNSPSNGQQTERGGAFDDGLAVDPSVFTSDEDPQPGDNADIQATRFIDDAVALDSDNPAQEFVRKNQNRLNPFLAALRRDENRGDIGDFTIKVGGTTVEEELKDASESFSDATTFKDLPGPLQPAVSGFVGAANAPQALLGVKEIAEGGVFAARNADNPGKVLTTLGDETLAAGVRTKESAEENPIRTIGGLAGGAVLGTAATRATRRAIPSRSSSPDVDGSGSSSNLGGQGPGAILDEETIPSGRTPTARDTTTSGDVGGRSPTDLIRDNRGQADGVGLTRQGRDTSSGKNPEPPTRTSPEPDDAGGTFADVRQDALTQSQDALRRAAQRERGATTRDIDPDSTPLSGTPSRTFDPDSGDQFDRFGNIEPEISAGSRRAAPDLEDAATFRGADLGGGAAGGGSSALSLAERAQQSEVVVDDGPDPSEERAVAPPTTTPGSGQEPPRLTKERLEDLIGGIGSTTVGDGTDTDTDTGAEIVQGGGLLSEPNQGIEVTPDVRPTPGTDTDTTPTPGTDTDTTPITAPDFTLPPINDTDTPTTTQTPTDTDSPTPTPTPTPTRPGDSDPDRPRRPRLPLLEDDDERDQQQVGALENFEDVFGSGIGDVDVDDLDDVI